MEVLGKKQAKEFVRFAKKRKTTKLVSILMLRAVPPDKREQVAALLVERYGDLRSIIDAEAEDLATIPGLAKKAIQELSRTKNLFNSILESRISDRPLLDDLESVRKFCQNLFQGKTREEFHALFLDNSYYLKGHECIQTSTIDHVMVYPRELMHRALFHNARHLILIHNHPGGRALPSMEDISVTEMLQQSGQYLGISILDHIIIGSGESFSFRKEGLLLGKRKFEPKLKPDTDKILS